MRPILFQIDPTRTTQLRKRFVSVFNQRWSHINKLIRQSVVENDCFGLRRSRPITLERPPSWTLGMESLPPRAFQFRSDPEKIDSFLGWLEEQTDKGIFSRDARGEYWFDAYQLEGYQRGIAWARNNVKANRELQLALGVSVEQLVASATVLSSAVRARHHIDKLTALYARSYRDLKGITATMDTQISRALADGFLGGESADKVVRRLTNRVDKIGKHRSTLLARTEIVRAHHIGTINEYRSLGVEGVEVQAEWLTARDDRVCSICRPHDGKRYTLDRVEPMIPAHPQCRCTTKAAFGPFEE